MRRPPILPSQPVSSVLRRDGATIQPRLLPLFGDETDADLAGHGQPREHAEAAGVRREVTRCDAQGRCVRGRGDGERRHGHEPEPAHARQGTRAPGREVPFRGMPPLKTSSSYVPTGDQPEAIATLSDGLRAGERYQTLLGATGTGKTATMAWIIEQVQKPALIIAHNKTLAAQLCNEFREFFPGNAVEYFVSYYDYYQPEAYVPQADLYIEKDSSQNDDIARLRLSATSSLFTRKDVIVVASVSCIYGLGSPEEWRDRLLYLEVGAEQDRDAVLRKLIESQYVRNDTVLGRGRFRVKGDILEVQPANVETAYRISFFGDEVEQITHFDPLTGEVYAKLDNLAIWPATEYVTSKPTIERAVSEIRAELESQVKQFEQEGRMLEAHRIRQRTEYDLELMQELGFCNGIENYSRILEGRPAGSHPFTLLDYFPDDFVIFVDESHQTVPQIGGMYEGDRSRKQTLVDYGFRLPSALDNRPLRFDEFLEKVPQAVFVSATPGAWELRQSTRVAEQLIRPTYLVDPEIELRPTQEPDRRPAERDPPARGRGGARARDDADEEDVRGPDRLPARGGRQGALPALRDRHARAHPDHPRAAARRLRRARRRQPPARGARPARGLARRDPRRGQGGLPARPHGARPDDRPRRAARQRPRADVRRQADRGDQGRGRRDDAPPRTSSSRTTRSTGRRRSRSSRASPTSPSSSRSSSRTCRARAAAAAETRSRACRAKSSRSS